MNMEKIYWTLILLIFSSACSFATPGSKLSSPVVYCSIKDLKADSTLLQKVSLSDDPAGLSIQAKGDADVGLALQGYANEHQCTLKALSMVELIKGLFKGSDDLFSNSGSSSQATQNGQKYIVVDNDTAECIAKLGLKLPVKQFTPVKINSCVLLTLSNDKTLKKLLTFSPDKIGIAFVTKNNTTDVGALLQQYATKHRCILYSISMMDLMSGLTKGLDTNAISQQSNPQDGSQGSQNSDKKYILISGDKALCMKKLRLKLPTKAYLPKQ